MPAGGTTNVVLGVAPPLGLSGVSLNPTSVTGGTLSTGTVTFTGAAPAGGLVVALSSNNAAAVVPTSVTVIAGTSSATFTVTTTAVAAASSATISASYGGATQTASLTLTVAPALFVSVSPCRLVDTRNPAGPLGGPAIAGGSSRDFAPPSAACGIPANAVAYSLNVTVVPHGPLGYLTIWQQGQARPVVSTLNSLDGRVKANAAIVPAGVQGGVSVYVTDLADVILDVNGYFAAPATAGALSFYPVAPCRISDTRNSVGPLGGPGLAAGKPRTIPVGSACGIPAGASAYSLNYTAIPSGPLGYLTTWPTGTPMPLVSTLNALNGAVTANAAIVPASPAGSVDVFATNDTDLVVDINGYFAPPGAAGAMSFYPLSPCRVLDTRSAAGPLGGPALAGSRDFPVSSSPCGISPAASAFSLNATVVPRSTLGYLTLWPTGAAMPVVSTLNSGDGSITSNAAMVRAAGGSISAFATDATDLILDINGYFAP
jgi:hypothetical protein